MKLTEPIARAAAWDAGNRHAKAANRTVWNASDYEHACDEYARLIQLVPTNA